MKDDMWEITSFWCSSLHLLSFYSEYTCCITKGEIKKGVCIDCNFCNFVGFVLQ